MRSFVVLWFHRLVLVSFVHMVVFPSWVWAMDSDAASSPVYSVRNAFRAERDSSIPPAAKHKQSDEPLLFSGEAVTTACEGDTCPAEANASYNQKLFRECHRAL